jgi:beta-fructofuranosidase
MLLAARKTEGPARRRGCIALASSTDLRDWQIREPLWAPDEYFTHECPDLFRIGGWFYLVYSTFSERFLTHYRMARDLEGPWLAPRNDSFDGRAYYAAKTAGTSQGRFVFGWLPTRQDESDEGGWQWGGNLVVHGLIQERDGTLSVALPQTVEAAFTRKVDLSPAPVLGEWQTSRWAVDTSAEGRHNVLLLGPMPQECLVRADVTFGEWTSGVGLLLRADEALDRYYQVRLEPGNQRVVLDRWPRPGDQPFLIERPLTMEPGGKVSLRLLVDGTCLVVYADDLVALSCRMYDHREGALGLFVTEGSAAFTELSLKVRQEAV